MRMDWFKIGNRIIDPAEFDADVAFVMRSLCVALQPALGLCRSGFLGFWCSRVPRAVGLGRRW